MGVWEWIYSATDAVKQKTPDLTPATEFGRKTYDYCRHTTSYAAAGGVAKARDLHQYLSDDQVRDNLGRFAKSASKNGALYLARSYGIIIFFNFRLFFCNLSSLIKYLHLILWYRRNAVCVCR